MRHGRPMVVGLAAVVVAGAVGLAGAGPAGARGDPAAEFVGAAACKKCHFKQWKSWKDTRMAKSFDILKAGQAAEAKTKAGLDAAKDYAKDASCLPCHTTGYGEPGGYPKVGEGTDEQRAAREGVQCEACHGAGSLYNDYMKKHEKSGYVAEEAAKLGLVTPDEKTCVTCHRGGEGGSPTLAADAKFDAAKVKDEKAVHVHPPKKK